MEGSLFLGYASDPPVNRDALNSASRQIRDCGVIDVVSWEDLKISGRVIIKRILEAIDASTVCAFDVSSLNENVMFELGYAIARAKIIWILLDKTDVNAKTAWDQFGLLKSIGYVGWENSEDIKSKFLNLRPDLEESSLYNDLIESEFGSLKTGSIFYVPTFYNTEPARLINRRLEQERMRGIQLVTADPTESALNSLEWYAAKAYESECTVVHFEASRRELASLHNPRSALVGGLAHGLDRELLMLAEEDYSPPLDYENLLSVYRTGRECELIFDNWLKERNLKPRGGNRTPRVRLATELRALRFGEHVAENEVDNLTDYFIVTGAFDDVMADRNALFVGRKGTGKTANMLQAAARLSEDARNLVVVIKPAAYEFTSLLELLDRLPVSMQQYSIEALWRFLLTSEIANQVVGTIELRHPGIPFTEDERKLLEYVDTVEFRLRDGFGVRFERTVNSLSSIPEHPNETEGRDYVNEALHSEAIEHLRSLLGPVLRGKQRIALLIDNLDKGWEKTVDLDLLSQLLLGLLSAVGRVKTDFAKKDVWREPISLTTTTFLRSDIFAHVLTRAREPDKIPASKVTWDDPETLLRVVEERFLAARPDDTDPDELWSRFFCPTVDGTPTRRYLVSRVLPRPRDLIYLCNAVASAATNRGNQRIELEDIRSGEMVYSQFAFESLLVENGITISMFKTVLFEFLGESPIISHSRVREIVARAGVADELLDKVVDRLREVSFLGIETSDGRFEYPDWGNATERADVLARKLTEVRASEFRYAIHPAYRPYLEIADVNESEFVDS